MALFKEDPKKLIALLNYASTFPDFPKNFSPPGLTDPNYVPPTNYQGVEMFAYIMAPLTTIAVITRLWIRKRVKGMVFGWDDWLAIPGQIFTLALIVVMILLIKVGGAGRHVYDVSFDVIERTQKLEFAGVMIYFTTIWIIRTSITAFLYRLMGRASSVKRWLLHITVVILFIQFLVQVFAYVFSCKPISAAWDMNVRLAGFTSVNIALEIFIITIFYLVMDVWLLVLPIHTIWTLQLPLRTRIGVTWVFVFGAIACAGAILKTAHIYSVFESYDSLWKGRGFMVGALIEVSFGTISASMPALNHLIITTFPRRFEAMVGSERFTRWFSSGSSGNKSRSKSFKESFHEMSAGNSSKPDSMNRAADRLNRDTLYLGRYEPEEIDWRYEPKDLESGPMDLKDMPITTVAHVYHKDLNHESWLNLR